MTGALTQVIVWLNAAANAAGGLLLAPAAVLPGWLSATLAGAVTGVVLLVVFKYTSHQRAVRAVRNDIKANLLALRLFKDNPLVTLEAQGGVLVGAGQLLALALVPMLVMLVPVCLILGQLGLWYQARPLRVGEDTVLTLRLPGGDDAPFPEVYLQPTAALEVLIGPVRVQSKRELCWSVKANADGYHRLVFQVGGQTVEKEFAVGDGFMRVSARRPEWSWEDVLRHPAEAPFRPDAPVRSIEIEYPSRPSWTSGTDWWVVYWFAVSMVAALCFRRALNVQF
jgi:hypothetical protein